MSYKEVDFSAYSSIRIGPKKQVFLIEEEVGKGDFFIVGGANNIIVSDSTRHLAMLSKRYDFIELKNGYLHVGGATSSGRVFSFAKKHNLKGFEILSKLPGKMGGIVKMNAGLKGDEIGKNIVAVRLGEQGFVDAEEITFAYRKTTIDEIVYEVVFAAKEGFDPELVEQYRIFRDNQPNDPSVGSCFKNPPNDYAGRLIESVGLKGHAIGGAAFSDKHANFLINRGDATFKDARALIEEAQKKVYESSGIVLELEAILV